MSQDHQVTSIEQLAALYKAPVETSLRKVVQQITPNYRAWLERSQFVVLTTVGPEGTDASPRGDNGPVVTIEDARTLLLPDWKGNNRIDSLRNIVRDDRVSLMFMVAGSSNVVRVNGTAQLSTDPTLGARFERSGKQPVTVIRITIGELYFQCAKAIMRAELWTDAQRTGLSGLPTAGDFLREVDEGFDGERYDLAYPERAKANFW